MKTFPSREALVRAYWRKLANSLGDAYKGHGRALARRAARALQTHRRRSRGSTIKGMLARQGAVHGRIGSALARHPRESEIHRGVKVSKHRRSIRFEQVRAIT